MPANRALGINANKVDAPKKELRSKLWESRRYKTKNNLGSDRSQRCGLHTLGHFATIGYNLNHNSSNIGNIESCGSVWACPVCRYKIMSRRAGELKHIVDSWKSYGYHQSMITFTVPHNLDDSLSGLFGNYTDKTGISGAIKLLRQSRTWKNIKTELGYVADCRAVETTYGSNGWHLHIHMAVFHTHEVKPHLQRYLLKEWTNSVTKSGLQKPNDRGVYISTGMADYLAKWGAPNELLSEYAKDAKNGNVTLSRMESLINSPYNFNRQLAEYYEVTKGRKLLTWAGQKGFKKQFLKEYSDNELVDQYDLIHMVLAKIPVQTWFKIYWRGKTGELLSMVESEGVAGLYRFLAENDLSREKTSIIEDSYFRTKPDKKADYVDGNTLNKFGYLKFMGSQSMAFIPYEAQEKVINYPQRDIFD